MQVLQCNMCLHSSGCLASSSAVVVFCTATSFRSACAQSVQNSSALSMASTCAMCWQLLAAGLDQATSFK
jgi:hypothetical protein